MNPANINTITNTTSGLTKSLLPSTGTGNTTTTTTTVPAAAAATTTGVKAPWTSCNITSPLLKLQPEKLSMLAQVSSPTSAKTTDRNQMCALVKQNLVRNPRAPEFTQLTPIDFQTPAAFEEYKALVKTIQENPLPRLAKETPPFDRIYTLRENASTIPPQAQLEYLFNTLVYTNNLIIDKNAMNYVSEFLFLVQEYNELFETPQRNNMQRIQNIEDKVLRLYSVVSTP